MVGGNDLVGEYKFRSRTSVGGPSSVLSVRVVGIVGRQGWIVAVVASAIRWLWRRWWWFSRIVASIVRVWRWVRHGFVA